MDFDRWLTGGHIARRAEEADADLFGERPHTSPPSEREDVWLRGDAWHTRCHNCDQVVEIDVGLDEFPEGDRYYCGAGGPSPCTP